MISPINQIMASATNGAPIPEPGMGCTVLMYSDRRAGTITRVSPSGKTFWFTYDKVTRIDGNGMSDCQDYAYETVQGSPEVQVRRNKRGQWKEKGGSTVAVGYRREYYDYSF